MCGCTHSPGAVGGRKSSLQGEGSQRATGWRSVSSSSSCSRQPKSRVSAACHSMQGEEGELRWPGVLMVELLQSHLWGGFLVFLRQSFDASSWRIETQGLIRPFAMALKTVIAFADKTLLSIQSYCSNIKQNIPVVVRRHELLLVCTEHEEGMLPPLSALS